MGSRSRTRPRPVPWRMPLRRANALQATRPLVSEPRREVMTSRKGRGRAAGAYKAGATFAISLEVVCADWLETSLCTDPRQFFGLQTLRSRSQHRSYLSRLDAFAEQWH